MHKYPLGLLDWSGEKAGGVKKLFYAGSGRPAGAVINTRLLELLSDWARDLATNKPGTPRAIFLIGGPGNGKTEAIEHTIGELDTALGTGGALQAEFSEAYLGANGGSGRLVSASRTKFPSGSRVSQIDIVQDGSEGGRGVGATPAELLCDDMQQLLRKSPGQVYLACVNRGVLDDALIRSTERGDADVGSLIKAIVQSVSLGAKGINCWPLEGFPEIAVWPMDVESLVDEEDGKASAARQILDIATNPIDWPEHGTCVAGDRCPFCTSRKLLSADPHKSSYLRTLRWFELASGKRWNFRDLFSLTSFLLSGTTEVAKADRYRPCDWAKSMLCPTGNDQVKIDTRKVRNLFSLVAAQYQHAIFGKWPTEKASALRSDLRELKLESVPALAGLHQFLSLDSRRGTTSTLRTQLAAVSAYLDPAFAGPALDIALSVNTTIKFEKLDHQFSRSIKEARLYLQRFQCLTILEVDLLKVLEEADAMLSDEAVRRRKPAVAERVQAFIRLIACRVARRSIGLRCGVTKDADVLDEFSQVLMDNKSASQTATRQVEGLLNSKDRRFLVSLNTTFGEPLPPPERRAMLTTDLQRVTAIPISVVIGRPRSPVRFLKVGSGDMGQPIALTYELFKATKSLRKGMIPASLPRAVVALLDTTRARLAGYVVRDQEVLQASEIRIGIRSDWITLDNEDFVVSREGN
jgi:hypothetical protein